jgi:dihydrofolate reductase
VRVSIIAAVAENRTIGKNNRLPWHIPDDLAWFKRKTRNHPVIMGRKTFEAMGKLLPERKNIILSRRPDFRVEGAMVTGSLKDAIQECRNQGADEAFVIGGETLFREALDIADRIYLTRIHRPYEGDSRFPPLEMSRYEKTFEAHHGGDPPFTFLILDRKV